MMEDVIWEEEVKLGIQTINTPSLGIIPLEVTLLWTHCLLSN